MCLFTVVAVYCSVCACTRGFPHFTSYHPWMFGVTQKCRLFHIVCHWFHYKYIQPKITKQDGLGSHFPTVHLYLNVTQRKWTFVKRETQTHTNANVNEKTKKIDKDWANGEGRERGRNVTVKDITLIWWAVIHAQYFS